MSKVRLTGSTSGYTELTAPATAGNNTLTLPTGNGTAGQVLQTNGSGALSWAHGAASGPAFRAYASSTTSAAHNTTTKIAFGTENFDTTNAFDTTLSRFTPAVAGYYAISGNLLATGGSGGIVVAQLFKNGSVITVGPDGNPQRAAVQDIVYLNGSTDYLELFIFNNRGVTVTVSTGTENTNFSGFLARPA